MLQQPQIPGPLAGVDLVRIIDTSAAQGAKWADDLDEIMAAGIALGIFKAADGEHDTDGAWEHSAEVATAKGFPFLGYCVLEPYGATRVDTQVQNAAARLKGSGAFGAACDHELAKGETGIVALESAADYMDGLEQATGMPVGYYSAPAFDLGLESLAKSAGADRLARVLARLAKRWQWIADYRHSSYAAGAPQVAVPGADWSIWQLGPAESTLPNGKPVDFNLFRGTLPDLLGLVCVQGPVEP